jgi:hypothetical protein
MSTAAAPVRPARPHTKWRFAVAFGVLGAIVVGVIVLAFVWPSATARAQNLPVGISGPSAQVKELKAQADKQDPNPFAFQTVTSRADAVRLIKERKIAGAFLLGTKTEVLVASAGSSVAAQALRGVATTISASEATAVEAGQATAIAGLGKEVAVLQAQLKAAAAGTSTGTRTPSTSAGSTSSGSAASSVLPTVTVTDVVPLSSDDPTGGGLNSAGFPLVLGGMLGGVLISLLVVGVLRRLLALVVYGVAAGVLATLVLQTLLHALQRDWLVNAAAFGLSMVATAALVVGFNSLIGTPGIAVGSVLSILIGNPISGAAIPYQFIAGPWGDVGQFFVAGAASNLVRSLSYFPDADTTKQWLVLAAWAVGGLVLAIVGHFRSAAPIPLPAGELEPAV